jgi:hypothetical protein
MKANLSILEEYILNKTKHFQLVIAVQGYMQMGKSTLVWFLMNKLSKLRGEGEWDFKKYCARDLTEFIDMIDKYEDKLLVYEEASKDISVNKWYDNLNYFFNIIMQTQAYKHNLVTLVFPHVAGISKRQRYFIKLGLEVTERIDTPELKATIFRPTIYTRYFYKLDENDIYYKWWGSCFVKWKEEDLIKAKEYTTWIEQTLKKNTMISIKRKLAKQQRKDDVQNFVDLCAEKGVYLD